LPPHAFDLGPAWNQIDMEKSACRETSVMKYRAAAIRRMLNGANCLTNAG